MSVENEFVVAADGVHVDERAAEGAGGVGDELLADVALGVVPRAGGEIDREVDVLRGERGDGIGAVKAAGFDERIFPDVLADRHADAQAVVLDDTRGAGGFEVAVLVENVVGGQERFAGDGGDFAIVAEGGGVEKAATLGGGIRFDKADERGHGADLHRDFVDRILVVGHETAFEKEVARRVAGDGEFGEDHEFRALRDEAAVGVEDFGAIAGEVADGGVDLCEADAHGSARE